VTLGLAAPAVAGASNWPAGGGGPERLGHEADLGVLPPAHGWGFDEQAATPPIITGGATPAQQRVAYGTTDGHVHLRVLTTGAEIGTPGGTRVADGAVTDAQRALRSAFVSSSGPAANGVLFVVHDDGGGIEIARFDEATGARMGDDVPVPGSFGCREAGAPLLTPVAEDGTRLLFFTMAGSCPSGEGLVRFGVGAQGELFPGGVARVPDVVAGVAPALFAGPQEFLIAVARPGAIELWPPGGAIAEQPRDVVELDGEEVPAALASGPRVLLVLSAAAGGSRLRLLAPGAAPELVASATLDGRPLGLASDLRAEADGLAGHVAATTVGGLTLLELPSLAPVRAVPAGAGPVSMTGTYAFAGAQAVRLADGATEPLGPLPRVAPALADGFVSFGPLTLFTRDVVAPTVALGAVTAARARLRAGDDRGVTAVVARVRSLRLSVAHARGGRYDVRLSPLAPGRWRLLATAHDAAGNRGRVARAVTVRCGRSLRGGRRADRLRGRDGRDCIEGSGGGERVDVTGRGADRVRCGTGDDQVAADVRDRIAPDCERVRRARP
jgi:hypothetical protein